MSAALNDFRRLNRATSRAITRVRRALAAADTDLLPALSEYERNRWRLEDAVTMLSYADRNLPAVQAALRSMRARAREMESVLRQLEQVA